MPAVTPSADRTAFAFAAVQEAFHFVGRYLYSNATSIVGSVGYGSTSSLAPTPV
jgi:hypothetical protein